MKRKYLDVSIGNVKPNDSENSLTFPNTSHRRLSLHAPDVSANGPNCIIQIPASSGQNGGQMSYPIVGFEGFVCHIKEQSASAPAVFNENLLKTFFVSQSLTNATSLSLNSSISSTDTCFIAVSDFGAQKKTNYLKPDTSGSIFPTPRRQRTNSPLPGHRR